MNLGDFYNLPLCFSALLTSWVNYHRIKMKFAWITKAVATYSNLDPLQVAFFFTWLQTQALCAKPNLPDWISLLIFLLLSWMWNQPLNSTIIFTFSSGFSQLIVKKWHDVDFRLTSTYWGARLFTEVMGITKFLHKLRCSSPAEADDWHGAVQYEVCAMVLFFVCLLA